MIRAARLIVVVFVAGTLTWLAGCSSSNDTTQSSSSTSTSTVASADSSATGTPSSSEVSLPSEAATDPNTSAPASSEAPPPVTTPVPAPGGGDVNQTVPEVALTTNAPVELTGTGDFGGGVTVALTSIESITTTAQLPGEIAGPGVKVTVTVTNGSADAVDLNSVIVDLQDAAGAPAIPMTSGSAPFTGSVAAGQSAAGTYVFTVPSTYTNPATISISYSTAAPIVVFQGDAK